MIRAQQVGLIALCLGLSAFGEQTTQPPMLDLSKTKTHASAPSGARTMLLMPLPAEAAWQDMAFLAAVPAATVVNRGAPSLVALSAPGALSPEIQDYARRYRPDAVYLLGGSLDGLTVSGRACELLKAGSADEAACALSATFWRTSATAVICSEEDYQAGLIAAPLAARLRVPLLFARAQGLSRMATKELRRLQSKELLVVGNPGGGVASLKEVAERVTELADARAVMAWTRRRGLKVSYLAALNPLDRGRTVIKKLSLSGALLAAGRDGLVVPLSYQVQWKKGFKGTEMKGERPEGLPKSEANPKSGRIVFGRQEYAFVLTGKPQRSNPKINIDLDGDGKCTGPGEGPFSGGDVVELAGKRQVITLVSGYGADRYKADVLLTCPVVEQPIEELKRCYDALGGAPEHLCLVGFPDAVPQAITGRDGMLNSDLPYSNADDDPFAEIGVARVVAENVSFATLFASRVLTYPSLLDAEWQDRACQARWENTAEKQFENVGFDASYRHTIDHLKWLVPPSEGKEGKRARTFEQDSPLTRCAALTHEDHSWWQELGHTFGWDAEVLLAPVVVESGGCLTALLDVEPDCRSVIARLFRKGAVAFAGNARPGCAPQEVQRMEFWNGVLSGQTIGQAHRRSINSALVTVLDRKEGEDGVYRYQLRIRTQFGDPAFAMHVPGPPRSAPARVTVDGATVTVHAPAQWWPVKICVPEDWKQWADKDLFVLRGAGTYARREWCREQYDREEMYVTAEFTTRRRVAKIEQVQKPPAPLGWNGSFYVDEHADGSRTFRWSVRLADFEQTRGKIVNAVERLDYRMVYE